MPFYYRCCKIGGGDTFKKDDFKDATIRLVAQVNARNVKGY